MFTGIIEEMGTMKSMEHVSDQAVKLKIGSDSVISDVNSGDSIAVNGICLTVTDYNSENFQVDVMPETIKSTSLSALKPGSKVNLERSMAANGRFGGHFVSGHIDGKGKIIRKERQENAVYYDVQIAKELAPFFIKKGSVAVDGISLTVFHVEENTFTISLIPHTVSETVLGEKNKGDTVNIECDMLAKYMQQMLEQQKQNSEN
ncbi:riboflavin synthase [Virgibacillus sp. NKC19-16]|uniref:riboflavin synthase n=1 Tax=Virgibacillus salidurans TaxID=2831673 RepID=UPI001EFFC5E3|nr:riboflavin synthase [Virgibacillus sp. NKC19-16]UJL47272.1 riboflavin synthase [Virgibacillus sp. NKC19-16]